MRIFETTALAYTRRGWRVFPCAPRGKVPLTAHGLKDASTDEKQLTDWWDRWPSANIGVATGAESGFFVLDVDGKDGNESLATLEREHGPLPTTVEAKTGGGGRHLLFKHPGQAVKNSAGRLGPGLDVRGDGGYIVAPSSIHPTGKSYE